MANETVVGITVRATDEASRVIADLRGQLDGLKQRVGVLAEVQRGGQGAAAGISGVGLAAGQAQGQIGDFGRRTGELAVAQGRAVESGARLGDNLRVTGQAARALAVPLADVALGAQTVASRMAGVVASGAALGGTFGVIVAVTGVATLALGELAEAWDKAAKRQRDFAGALATNDLPLITGQVRELTKEIAALAEAREKAARNTPEGVGIRLPEGLVIPGYDPNDPQTGGRLEQSEIDKRLKLIREREQVRERLQFGQDYAASEADTKRIADEIEATRLRLRLDQQGLRDFARHPIDARAAQAEREAQRLDRESQPEAAARIRGAAAEERRVAFFRTFRAPEYAAASAAAGDESLAFRVDNQPSALEERETIAQLLKMQTPEYIRQRAEDLRQAGEAGEEALAFRPADQAAISRRTITELLTLEQQRAQVEESRIDVLARIQTYSDAEADALETRVAALRQVADLRRIEAEITAQAAIAETTGTQQDQERLEILLQQREAVRERYAIEEAGRQRERTLRYDPLEGAKQGLQDFEDLAARQGERMRAALFGAMAATSQGITEILVQGISGDFERVADVGKQLGQMLMRSIIQELVVAPLVGALSNTLRGALSSLQQPGALGTGRAAAGGGLLALLGLGGAAPAAAATVGVAPNAPIGAIVQTAAGPGVVTASGAVVVGGGGAAALQAAGGAAGVAPAIATGSGVAPFADGSGFLAAESTTTFQSAGAAAPSVSLTNAAIGGVAGVAAVGLSAYAGYQTATTTQDVVFAGVAGGLSGAAAGSQIGGYFGESGYGALIGAVAGAAISAGAAAYGKSKNQPKKEEQEKQELAGPAQSFQPMFADLDLATTPQELWDVVRRYTHQGAGGERSGEGDAAGLIVTVDVGGRRLRVISEGVTPDQLVENGDSAMVEMILGVAADLKAPFEQRIADAIKQAAARIKALGQAVRVFFDEQIGGGITRTTVLAYSRLAEAAGQDLNVVSATLEGLTPEVRGEILERIAQSDMNGALDLYAVESNLANKVKVGEFTREKAPTAPGPGGVVDGATPEPPQEFAPDGTPLERTPGQGPTGDAGDLPPGSPDPSVPPTPSAHDGEPLFPLWIEGTTWSSTNNQTLREEKTYRYLIGLIQDEAGKVTPIYSAPSFRAPLDTQVPQNVSASDIGQMSEAGTASFSGLTSNSPMSSIVSAVTALVTSTPVGFVGQAFAFGLGPGLTGLMSQSTANLVGNVANIVMTFVGALPSAINTLAGIISLALQGQNPLASVNTFLGAVFGGGGGSSGSLTTAEMEAIVSQELAQGFLGQTNASFGMFSDPSSPTGFSAGPMGLTISGLPAPAGAATGIAPPQTPESNFGTGASPGGGAPGIGGPGGVGGPGGEGGQEAQTGGWVSGLQGGRVPVDGRRMPVERGDFIVRRQVAAAHAHELEELFPDGSWVPGEGYGDIVPAVVTSSGAPVLLEPREFHVPREDAVEVGPELEALNAGNARDLLAELNRPAANAARYQDGGWVAPQPVVEEPTAADVMPTPERFQDGGWVEPQPVVAAPAMPVVAAIRSSSPDAMPAEAPARFQEGGWVQGDPVMGDVVPAVVGPAATPIRMQGGEYVVRAEAAAAHAGELEEINRKKPGKWPRPGVDRPSDEVIFYIGERLFAMNHKRDLKWWPDSGFGPLNAARGI